MKKCAAAVLLATLFTACARQMPITVGADEYDIYSAWLRQHYYKSVPETLYIEARTFKFDPFDTAACNMARNSKSGVPMALMKQLHAIGDAEYRLRLNPPDKSFVLPWRYKVADDWLARAELPRTARIVSFSRVAFDSSHRSALFMFYVSCGPLCGYGNAVYAQKKSEAWQFTNTGCFIQS